MLFTYQGKTQQLPRAFKTPEGKVLPLWQQYTQGLITLEQLAELGFVPYVVPEPTIEEQRQMMIVTPWQFRKALNQTGNRGAVNQALNTADQDTKDGWEVASSFERLHPMIVSFGAALGLSDTELDDLFTLAATL